MAQRPNEYPLKIVFIDGVCVLCNRAADLLMKMDRKNTLRFATLQGTTAADLLTEHATVNGSSIIYWRNGEIFSRSTAILKILSDLGAIWKLSGIFWIVPRPIRDAVYQLIASHRYKWFGKRQTCRMPTEADADRLLS